MQSEAAEAFDVSREPQHVLDMYGPGNAGTPNLDRAAAGRARSAVRPSLARRRQPWDSHNDIFDHQQPGAANAIRPSAR